MEVYLIRHTRVDVPQGVCYGQTDVPLAQTFPEEAAAVKEKLTGLTFDAVFTSPLSRASKLAAFCGYADAVPDKRLLELNFGDWEMQNYNDLYATSEEFRLWCNDFQERPTPHGESLKEQEQRFMDFLQEQKGKGLQRIAVFTHGGILSLALDITKKGDTEEVLSHVPPYGSVVTVNV